VDFWRITDDDDDTVVCGWWLQWVVMVAPSCYISVPVSWVVIENWWRNATQIDCVPWTDDVIIMTLSKKLCPFKIKFPAKRIFRIFPILRISRMAPLVAYLSNDRRTFDDSVSCTVGMYCVVQRFSNWAPRTKGSATGSQGVRERIPKSSHCLHGF